MYSGIISLLVASSMIITSIGMPVTGDALLEVLGKNYEIVTESEEILPDDPIVAISNNEILEIAEGSLRPEEETIDNVSGNEVNGEEPAVEDEGKTVPWGNDPKELEAVEIQGSEGTESKSPEEVEIKSPEAAEAQSITVVKSTDIHGMEATAQKVIIRAAGIYSNWDGISNVTQFKDPRGGMYYAINSDSTVKIYKVEAGVPVSGVITLEKKHPLFGTVTCDSDGNFYLITGKENKTNDTSVETVFISKYDSTGKFIATTGDNGSSSLADYYGSEFYTKIPFHAGNCDAAIAGDILTVHYARKMYSDHQSNSVFSVNIKDMSKVDVGVFYQSHSFAQRVVPMGEGFVYVSEGDCYDRSFTIYHTKKENGIFTGIEKRIFDFWVKDGALEEYDMYVVNENFAHMGGITALRDGKVAFAAQSAKSLNSAASGEKEDIFLQIFDPSAYLGVAEAYTTEGIRSGLAGPNGRDEVTNYGVSWLTSLSETERVSNVQVASTSRDNIVVLFEYYKEGSYQGVYYIVIDGDGEVIQPATVFHETAMLNPCEMPVYTDGMICWMGNKYGESEKKIYAYSLEIASDKKDIAGGTYADVIWKIDAEGVLTVKGKGDYGEQPPWHSYSGKIVAAYIELSQVTTLQDMFRDCHNMRTVELGGLDTSQVLNMSGMFRGCNALIKADVSGFNTSKVRTMTGMFQECVNLTAMDLSNLDVAQVTDMAWMLENCRGLKSIKSPKNLMCNIDLPEGNWVNRSTGQQGISSISANTADGTWFADADYVAATGIGINKAKIILGKNDTEVLRAFVLPNNATNQNVKWSSNNKEIAKVDSNGKVTAVSAGEAIITARSEDGDYTVTSRVTVLAKNKAEVVMAEGDTITKTYGGSRFALDVDVKDEEAGSGLWTWDSSDEKVATVSEEGVVTIKGVGESVIKAHFESDTAVGEATATLKVQAKTLELNWNNTSFIYDGAPHKPTAVISGVIIGDDCTVTVSGEQTEEGSYTASAALAGAASGNYILPEDNKTCSFTIRKIKVANLNITGASHPVFMQKGDKIQLGVRVTPANAADKNVEWSSSNPTVAEVDDKGLITAVSEGEAVITAKAKDGSNAKATLTVTVSSVQVSGITLRVTGTTVMVPGASQQIEAVIKPSNAENKELLWTSSDEKIATVTEGIITVQPENVIEWGDKTSVEVKITASASNNIHSSLTFIIRKPEYPVSAVKIDPKAVREYYYPGDTFRLSAIIEPSNATDKTVTWESSQPDKAVISSTGMVTVKDYGETTITVKAANGQSDSYQLAITKIPVEGITVNTVGGDPYLTIGKRTQLSAIVTPANASVREVVWESLDPNLAEIDENGVVTGKAKGRVTIRATAKEEKDKKAEIELMIVDGRETLYVEFAEGWEYTYTGKPIKPLINVYHRGRLLMEGTDYTVKYSNNINANDGTNERKAPKVVVKGKSVAATAEAVFSIRPLDIGDKNIVLEGEVNTAYGKTAAPLLYYGGTKLGNKDFTNPYAKDKFTVSRGITVYGKGNFAGEREVWINVMDAKEVKKIPKIKVLSFTPAKRLYNGQQQYISAEEILVVSASDKSKTPLEMNKDFYIAYPKDGANVGTVKISVIGMGDYAGVVRKSYKIGAAKKDESVKDIEISFPYAEGMTNGYDSFEYKPQGVRPAIKIQIQHNNGNMETLVAGRDYKVAYKNNSKAGVANKNKPASATITFQGNYKSLGKMTKNFYIDQAELSKANTYAPDKVITKAQPKYPLSNPIVAMDGITLNKKEYTVTYKVNGKPVTSKDKLYRELSESGEFITVNVEIKAKTDKNGAFTGNYKGSAASCHYRIIKSEASHNLSKASIILQKKGDSSHKAVTRLSYNGKPIEIGKGDFLDYELFVYMGNKKDPVVLKEGIDFQVTYSNNVNAGKATVVINGYAGGKYQGSKTFNFRIVNGKMFWIK